ncbi:MarR family winged helix-turn-helix transcriptional regulator [Neolewinella antarctica]|uniref:DNA-binding MarR family transcriptional regulator n=1 Tax=Neolewinella antarctica TaxID=442734 RepID=A0ABX0X872_9BACT|nr:MarR family transcriptional regulator [Neolewinella antarctica]NJC25053.1 DNA-binding MarR family transcriptional regulator [Neolewinella antarctica]
MGNHSTEGAFRCNCNQTTFPLDADHPAKLIFLTNRVGRQLARATLPTMEFEGFQPLGTHVGLLADLFISDGQRQQDLAITGIKDKATVARSLAQLLEAGFVTRVADSVDRRQKLIFVSEKGRRFWAFIEAQTEAIIPEITKDIHPKKMAVCLEVLSQIYGTLHEQGHPQQTPQT